MKSFYAYGAKVNLVFAALLILVLAICGCATPPAADQSGLQTIALQFVTQTAVGRVIERDNADHATQVDRAQRIVTIATAVQALGADALSTLPQVTAALAPLLDRANLSPMERGQADILVQALAQAALERVKIDHGTTTYATVNLVLTNVIIAAKRYDTPS